MNETAAPVLRFFVAGEPKGQPRPRAFAMRIGDKATARMYDSGTADDWKVAVVVEAKQHRPATPFTGPVALQMAFWFRRPKSHYGSGKNAAVLRFDAPKYQVTKPDADNLAKAVMDALTTMGGLWNDDTQVAQLRVVKCYGDTPGMHLEIGPL